MGLGDPAAAWHESTESTGGMVEDHKGQQLELLQDWKTQHQPGVCQSLGWLGTWLLKDSEIQQQSRISGDITAIG